MEGTTDINSLIGKVFPVLDDGHVIPLDVMGGDDSIVQAARVSYGKATRHISDDRNLIRYLMRHSHTTPFEMCEIKFRVRVPMDCWRQWIRHRMSSTNEYSTRYSEAIDSAQHTEPSTWRGQAMTNKQGSAGHITEWPTELSAANIIRSLHASPGAYLSKREQELQALAREVYEERLKFGVAREQARKDLPLSTYTEAYWKIDLLNLLKFLSLRMDTHAQWEIRQYANTMADIVKVWVPLAWEAFNDYDFRRDAMLLSRMEVDAIRALFTGTGPNNNPALTGSVKGLFTWTADQIRASLLDSSGFGKGREADEFLAKLKRLLGD